MVDIFPKKVKGSTCKRDRFRQYEEEIQKIWEKEKIHEAAFDEHDQKEKKKFLITYQYPYMEGALHMGKAFSMSKCEFTARHKRLA